MARYPIQIIPVAETEYEKGVLLVLANDGTLWGKYPGKDADSPWLKFPDLPQPEKTHV
jgi:hypothetical protein